MEKVKKFPLAESFGFIISAVMIYDKPIDIGWPTGGGREQKDISDILWDIIAGFGVVLSNNI